jgi:hypothetical protein
LIVWRRPRCESAACVEVADFGDPDHIGIRVPAVGGWAHITATRAEFAAFITAAKAGDYDDLYAEENA